MKIERGLQFKNAFLDFNGWELDFLIDYVEHSHHQYIRRIAPTLLALSDKVAKVHGAEHPELIEVNALVKELISDLIPHLQKEELVLFPNIKRLLKYKKGEITDFHTPPFGSFDNPIKMMEIEHDNAGDLIHKIAESTSNYLLPKDACNTYTVFFKTLKEFQNHLFEHVHIENNIIHPKTKLLVKDMSI
jgi:regulator of cell morphogenesis and NO signaling